MNWLIENLDLLVTVDSQDTVLRGGSILVENGEIAAIGPAEQIAERIAALAGPDRVEGPSYQRIDGRGLLAMPGLVNLHTHLPMALLRGIAEDVDLQGFLTVVWAAEAALMDPATTELGAQLGALESVLGGCTTQLDMYVHHEATHRGAVRVGVRHVGGPVFFDSPGPDSLTWAQRLEMLRAWPGLLAEIGGPVVPVTAMPHATYTVGAPHLAQVRTILLESAAGAPTLLTTHVSENVAENEQVRAQTGRTPTRLLADAGWLDPIDATGSADAGPAVPVVFGHGVHLTVADLATVAAARGSIAHCPGSNLKLASGALDWTRVRRAGVGLGVGTDGCSSSNDLDMFQAMRLTALLARLTAGRPDTAAARAVLRAATIDGARALGMGHLIGSLEVGKRADIVLLDLEAAHLTPVHDVAALLVFAAGRGDVLHVLVDGELVVADRRSTRIDQADLLARCRERAALATPATADRPLTDR